jgi:hypothetical protein
MCLIGSSITVPGKRTTNLFNQFIDIGYFQIPSTVGFNFPPELFLVAGQLPSRYLGLNRAARQAQSEGAVAARASLERCGWAVQLCARALREPGWAWPLQPKRFLFNPPVCREKQRERA